MPLFRIYGRDIIVMNTSEDNPGISIIKTISKDQRIELLKQTMKGDMIAYENFHGFPIVHQVGLYVKLESIAIRTQPVIIPIYTDFIYKLYDIYNRLSDSYDPERLLNIVKK